MGQESIDIPILNRVWLPPFLYNFKLQNSLKCWEIPILFFFKIMIFRVMEFFQIDSNVIGRVLDNWRICSVFNKQSTTHIVLNIYINSIVVLTVVLTPQSITTTTINSTLSSYSVFLFHPLQYNSHHFLSIFLIFKIIKTSFYPLIY